MRPSSGPGNNGSNQLVDFEDVFTGSESEGGIEAEGKEDKHLSTNTNQDFQISKRQLAEAGPGPSTMKRRRVDFESQVQTELEKPEGTKGFLLFYLLTIRNITDKLVMPGFQVDKPDITQCDTLPSEVRMRLQAKMFKIEQTLFIRSTVTRPPHCPGLLQHW